MPKAQTGRGTESSWFPPEARQAAARRRVPRGLLRLIAVELVVAAAVLAWLFLPDTPRPTPTPPESAALQAMPSAPATSPFPTVPPPPRVSLPGMPEQLGEAVRAWAARQPVELIASGSAGADMEVRWDRPGGGQALASVVLVPVAALPAERDVVSSGDLRRVWRGRGGPGAPAGLIVTPESGQALEALWGEPTAGAPVVTVYADAVADELWAAYDLVAIVPFERLEPRLKALSVDGQSVLDGQMDVAKYPLAVSLRAGKPAGLAAALADALKEGGHDTDWRPEHLTVVAMTGVTGLTRGVALMMEAQGDYAWPARHVADVLAAADLTHVSNEVSFLAGCEAQAETVSFCARPEYMETLRLIGTDVVELTGNHNLDFGPEYALGSLDLYAEEDMGTFGGGRDTVSARQPLVVEHNGNRLAFLGYNSFGPDYAWATADGPGAAIFSLEAVQADVAAVRPEADVVFVNIQYTEVYATTPLPAQVIDFRAIAEAGADVVTGSQAHQPQAIEFLGGTPIFYGLGNLFFDQTWSDAIRQSLIVRHVIYEGRLIAVELLPTVMGDDLQPRLAEAEERLAILREVFEASRELPE